MRRINRGRRVLAPKALYNFKPWGIRPRDSIIRERSAESAIQRSYADVQILKIAIFTA
jgi:hypothetical protein